MNTNTFLTFFITIIIILFTAILDFAFIKHMIKL